MDVLTRHQLNPETFKDAELYQAVGCSKCSDTGYAGRGAVMEVLAVEDNVRDAILRGDSTAVIRDIACQNGMMTLRDTGLARAIEGLTTIEEIMRVTASE